jgi:SAM-dependent methyltransferase
LFRFRPSAWEKQQDGRTAMSLIGFLLDRLYAELAWAYDPVSWLVSLGRWDGWRRVALRYVEGKRILEAGCGSGHLLPALAEGGRQACGCDSSPAMLGLARRRSAGRPLNVSLCRARAQTLPFATAAFDTVVCTFPAGYISDERTWTEFARVLAPGGRAVVVYGVSVGGRGLCRGLVRWLLAVGRTSGRELRPAWKGLSDLQVRHLVVDAGPDRVGLLIAEHSDGANAG